MLPIAILAVIEKKELERLAPAERAINTCRIVRVVSNRPVIEKRPLTDPRERILIIVVVPHLVIVPHDVPTRLRTKSAAWRIVAVGAVLGPELFEGRRGAARVGVNRVAQMHEKAQLHRADGAHKRERL